MKVKARTTIHYERYRRISCSVQLPIFVGYCAVCRATRRFSTPETAAEMISIDLRSVFRAIESGSLHCVEHDPRTIWICDESACGMADDAKQKVSD